MNDEQWRKRFTTLLDLMDMTDGELYREIEYIRGILERGETITTYQDIRLEQAEKLLREREDADCLISEQIAAGDFSRLG